MRAIFLLLVAAGTAHADDTQDTQLVGDVRALLLIRADNNYFTHASRFDYDLPGEAGGVEMTLGARFGSRVTLGGAAMYVEDGADRGDARLRLVSGAVLAVGRIAIARVQDSDVGAELAATGGFGRYYIKETFIDPGLSPMVYDNYAGSFGGFGGLEAALHAHGFRLVIAYGYHYAPARIDDMIRGSVEAGGHELSVGLGVSL